MRRRTMLLGSLATALPALAEDEALWALLRRGGQVVVIRHGLTDPGVGDPPDFRVNDCGTQLNLNDEGRREAQRLGEALRARGVPVAQVLSSPWCRCLDTARLAFGRMPDVEPALGNVFGRREREATQLPPLRRLVRAPAGGGNLFLVTHGSVTLALTGVSPATAEMVVLTPQADGGFRVAGRLAVR